MNTAGSDYHRGRIIGQGYSTEVALDKLGNLKVQNLAVEVRVKCRSCYAYDKIIKSTCGCAQSQPLLNLCYYQLNQNTSMPRIPILVHTGIPPLHYYRFSVDRPHRSSFIGKVPIKPQTMGQIHMPLSHPATVISISDNRSEDESGIKVAI